MEEILYLGIEAMRKILRIVFCILSVFFVLFAFFLGVWKGFVYALIGAAGALLFFVLMLFAKEGNFLKNPQEPHTDFMNSDEENEAILKSLQENNDDPPKGDD